METISFEQLVRDKQLGGDTAQIERPIQEYELIVIDEAQAFRNPGTDRARALRRLLAGSPPKKLALMSATPVNNSIWDLYYLLAYFVQNDAAFAGAGIRSLKECFRKAAEQDPDDLRPEMVFDILDATTVRRTRAFVKKYYPNDVVVGPNGIETPIRFPRPRLHSIRYSLDDVLPGFFDEFTEALMPEDDHPDLVLARYAPSAFLKALGGESEQDAALVGLIRSGLLKRFESSVNAFAETLERLVRAHDAFLDGLSKGYVLTAEAIEEWPQVDSGELEDLIARTGSERANLYRAADLAATAQHDRDLLNSFLRKARSVRPEDDPKLRELVRDGLKPILRQARKEAKNEDEFRRKRKILIFTYYADSVDWIYDYLLKCSDQDPELKPYRNRMVGVAGDESYRLVTREEAVFGFAPESGEAYRQELRKALEERREEIEGLPWGAGSGLRGEREGYFFCARVGDRVFLRFVPADGGAIVQESLASLRLIACTPATPRALTHQQRQAAYAAWERACTDIFSEWQFATDPANLQPKIRPLLRRAAEAVRKYPPPGMSQEELNAAVESLEAPWGARIENAIRDALDDASGRQASGRVVEEVKRLGLQRYQAPEPLPPIQRDEVHLVCWMALSR